MPLAYKKLAQVQLPAAAAVIYTVPGATQTIIKQIRLANTSGVDVAVTIYNGAADDAHTIFPTITIPAGSLHQDLGTISLAAGDIIRAVASIATSVTMTLWGVEIT